MTCARCHDHKFDPIPTKDYYSLHGIFASSLEVPEGTIISNVTFNTGMRGPSKCRCIKELAEFERQKKEKTKDKEKAKNLQKGEEIRTGTEFTANLDLNHRRTYPRHGTVDMHLKTRRCSFAAKPRTKVKSRPANSRKSFRRQSASHSRTAVGASNWRLGSPALTIHSAARHFVKRIWLHHLLAKGSITTPG